MLLRAGMLSEKYLECMGTNFNMKFYTGLVIARNLRIVIKIIFIEWLHLF